MKRLLNVIVAVFTILVSPLMILVWPLLFWVGSGIALYQWRKQASRLKQALPNLVCSVNSDCPPGFVCMGGRCVPKQA